MPQPFRSSPRTTILQPSPPMFQFQNTKVDTPSSSIQLPSHSRPPSLLPSQTLNPNLHEQARMELEHGAEEVEISAEEPLLGHVEEESCESAPCLALHLFCLIPSRCQERKDTSGFTTAYFTHLKQREDEQSPSLGVEMKLEVKSDDAVEKVQMPKQPKLISEGASGAV